MYTYRELDVDHTMLASRSQRLVNVIIDTIVLAIVLIFTGLLASILYHVFDYDGMLIWSMELSTAGRIVLDISIFVLYYVLMELLTQHTLGKYVSGTKVVMADGTKPGLGVLIVRTACRFIPLEFFSVFGETARAWHDSIPNVYVIDVTTYNRASMIKARLYDAEDREKNIKSSFKEI